MKRSLNIVSIAIIAFVCLLFIRYIDPIPLQLLRGSLFDFYQRLVPREAERFPVTIVDIDEKSLTEIGQWPWPRSVLSNLVNNLATVQPLVIGFDMVFSEPDRLSPSYISRQLETELTPSQLQTLNDKDHDQEFALTISQQKIVLGTMLNSSDNSSKIELRNGAIDFRWNLSPKDYLPLFSGRVGNLEAFESSSTGVGAFTLLPEADGVVRRVPTLFRVGDVIWPSFGLELLRTALGVNSVEVHVDEAGIDSITIAGINIPTNSKGLTWTHFNRHNQSRFVSAIDVLEASDIINDLAGHIVLVGTSASGLHDIKMTPMGQQMPGVEIWAQWLESSLFGNLLERPNYAFNAEVVFLMSFGLLLILLTVKSSAKISFLVYLGLTLSCIGFSWWMYSKKSQLFDFSFPVLAAGVLFAVLMLMKFWHEEQQRKQIKNAFSHYLSPSVVDELAASPEQLKLGGETKEITSIFTDLQGFTSLSESFEPQQLVTLINEYLDGICRIAIEHNGTIDKITGDAVHVFFGAPKDLKDHAQHAVDCALKIDEFCKQFSKKKRQQGFEMGETRIGVNSGLAVVGNFGGEERFDYTAYGDTINTASRLESANQYLGSTVCVSGSTAKLCQKHQFRPLADIAVKGRAESLMVYEPISQDSEVNNYLEIYFEIFSKIEHQDLNAIKQLKELHGQYPNDMVLKILLDSISHSSIISAQREFSEK